MYYQYYWQYLLLPQTKKTVKYDNVIKSSNTNSNAINSIVDP